MATVNFYQNATEVSATTPAVFYNNVLEKDQVPVTFTAIKPVGFTLCTLGSHWSSTNLPEYLQIVNMVSRSGESHGYLTVRDGSIASITETTTIDIIYSYGTSRTCDYGGRPDPIKTSIQVTVETRPDNPAPTPAPSPDPGPTPVPNPSPSPSVPPTNYPSVTELVQLSGNVTISTGPDGGTAITDETLVRHLSAAWVDARTPKEYNKMFIDINSDIAHSMTVVHKPDTKTTIGEYIPGSIQYQVVGDLPSYLTFEDYTTTDTGILHYIQSDNLGPNEEIVVGQVDNVIVRYRARYSSGVTIFGTLTLKVEFTESASATPTPATNDDISIDTWWVIMLMVIAALILLAGGLYLYRRRKN